MRCFVAIDIDEELRRSIGEAGAEIRRRAGSKRSEAKWVEPENMHLTLKFLGEVADEKTWDVCRIVEEAARRSECFSVEVGGIGWFGRPARVLWAGVKEQEQLSELWRGIDDGLAIAGWGKDAKGFKGHLTMCRIKSPRAGKRIEEAAAGFGDVELGVLDVESVCVYRSELTKTGPVYTVIDKIELADSR